MHGLCVCAVCMYACVVAVGIYVCVHVGCMYMWGMYMCGVCMLGCALPMGARGKLAILVYLSTF